MRYPLRYNIRKNTHKDQQNKQAVVKEKDPKTCMTSNLQPMSLSQRRIQRLPCPWIPMDFETTYIYDIYINLTGNGG